ncbi:DUF2190 family protein [Devosia ginsengisoli]|uniref:DUF2190 family protein n=1 Tax=Devosia ginsengisoli TaxID=400770 RepID=UPI0026EBDECE|nr:DUF2190 family protein [Devosia ginsengisoli]MCR6672195.1 DUF2190 family protein [Devosia ginsengisoli]
MKNFLSSGATITLTSAGAKASGTPYVAGDLVGIAGHSALTNEPVVLHLIGEFELPKKTAEAWAIGATLYWDPATSVCTTTAGELKKIGNASVAALAADTAGIVRLSN